jgi:hypothetical protein
MKDKIREFIMSTIAFTCLFLSVVYSWGAFEHAKNIDAKLRMRDSIILKMQHYQEHRDSITYDYLDKWINKLHER